MRRECRERFPPLPRFSDPDMHRGTFVAHVSWCMSGTLTSGSLSNQWRGKRSRQSRCMRNRRFYVSGKRPITDTTLPVNYSCFKPLKLTWRDVIRISQRLSELCTALTIMGGYPDIYTSIARLASSEYFFKLQYYLRELQRYSRYRLDSDSYIFECQNWDFILKVIIRQRTPTTFYNLSGTRCIKLAFDIAVPMTYPNEITQFEQYWNTAYGPALWSWIIQRILWIDLHYPSFRKKRVSWVVGL